MTRALHVLGWACLLAWLAVICWWLRASERDTQTRREVFLRERWELTQAQLSECRQLCSADRELSERSVEAWRLWMASLGMELVDAVSVQEDVIRFVTQQILDGWTELDSHAAKGCDAKPRNALDTAVREVAKRSGEVAKKEIENLERALKSETDRNIGLSQEIAKCGLKFGTHGFIRKDP